MQPLAPYERHTLPRIFYHGVDRYGEQDALRWREGGSWRALSYRDVEVRVERLAAALAELGVGRGDRVALLSENRPEWAITDYAILGLGAVHVPIYPTLPPGQIAYILNDCQARVVLVSTPEQLAKIQEVRAQVPALEHAVCFDGPGEEARAFADLLEQGHATLERGGAPPLRERALALGPEDLATLIYTSGTTGNPKGVMLEHRHLAYQVAATRQHGTFPVRAGEVALSFLPLSHVLERVADYYYWDSGVTIAYAESVAQVAESMLEVRPHYLVSVPRLYEKIHARMTGESGVRGRLVRWAVGVAQEVAEARTTGRALPLPLRAQLRLADRLVFARVRERMGGRVRTMVSGGAPLAAEVARLFFAAGLPVYEGYGLTETSPILAANRPGQIRFGTVGVPYPGVELRLDTTGEILARGPGVMRGYWNDPETTAKAIDAEGWLRTGDVGEIGPGGYLRITDRLKDLIVTAGGKNIAPQPVELQAATSPYIAQAVMIGDRRPFPVLLLVPERDAVLAWAATAGVQVDPARPDRSPEVRALLEGEAMGRLQGFARHELPKKTALLPEELSIDAGTLTPTLKVRRRAVEARYGELIEALYED